MEIQADRQDLSELGAMRRDSATPLYLQVKAALARYIEQGVLKAHTQIPSDRQLCALLGVSRITVRRALLELAQQGYVYTSPGKGTYVAELKRTYELAPFVGLSDDLKRRGYRVSSRILEASLFTASSHFAALFHIAPLSEVVKLVRLRLADDVPIALQTVYLPHAVCPALLAHDLERDSLYRILREEYRLDLASAQTTIKARLADATECKLLQVTSPAALLCTEQITFARDGRAVEWAISAFRADRYELSTSF